MLLLLDVVTLACVAAISSLSVFLAVYKSDMLGGTSCCLSFGS